jgi:hypothetical protein
MKTIVCLLDTFVHNLVLRNKFKELRPDDPDLSTICKPADLQRLKAKLGQRRVR